MSPDPNHEPSAGRRDDAVAGPVTPVSAETSEPGAVGTLQGAVLLLVVGIALGVVQNALGLRSHPSHGIPWIATADSLPSLESLAPAATSAPTPARTIDSLRSSPFTPPAPATESARPTADALPHATAKGPTAGKAADARKPATSPAPGASNAAPSAASAGASSSPASEAAPDIPDVPGPLTVELATFKKIYDAKAALIVDAREAEEFETGHVAGATSLPYNDALAEPERAHGLDPRGRPIVVYCSAPTCDLARNLAKFLVKSGKRRVLLYEAGYVEWSAAGYPTARGAAGSAR